MFGQQNKTFGATSFGQTGKFTVLVFIMRQGFNLAGTNWHLQSQLYVETRPPVIWTGKNEYGREKYGRTGGGRVKNEGAKSKVFQNHRYC